MSRWLQLWVFAIVATGSLALADQPVDTRLTQGKARNNRGQMVLTSGPEGYLLAWSEWRRTSCAEWDLSTEGQPLTDYFALRLRPDLSQVDPVAFMLYRSPVSTPMPSYGATSHSTGMLVLLGDGAGLGMSTLPMDGGGLQPLPRTLLTPCSAPEFLWTGSEYLATWWHNALGNYYTLAGRFDSTGQWLEAGPVSTPGGAYESNPHSILIDGGWIVSYTNGVFFNGAYVSTRRDSDGGWPQPSASTMLPTGSTFALATPSTGFLAYVSGDAGTRGYYRRIDQNNALLDATDRTVSLSGANWLVSAAAVDTDQFWLVGFNTAMNTLYGVRIREDGTDLDPAGRSLASSSNMESASAVTRDGGIAVSWMTSDGQIRVTRVTTAGAVLDFGGRQIVLANNAQRRPTVAAPGLVAWLDEDSIFGNPEVRFRVFFSDGGASSPASVIGAPSPVSVSAAFDGTYYVMAVVNQTGVLNVHRLLESGVQLGAPIQIGTNVRHSDIAFAGNSMWVLWTDRIFDRVTLTRITSSFTLGASTTVYTSSSFVGYPKLASTDAGMLATWTDNNGNGSVSARRYTNAGVAIDGTVRVMSNATSFTDVPMLSSIASVGGAYRVAWSEDTGSAKRQILSCALEEDGGVVGPIREESPWQGPFNTSAMRNTIATVNDVSAVIWETDQLDSQQLKLQGRLWYPDGGVSPVFVLGNGGKPALVFDSAGTGLLAYEQFDDTLVAPRVWTRTLTMGELETLAWTVADAGIDAGVDAGVVDAGVVDAGLFDAGFDDAGLSDAGLDDAGLDDAGLDGGTDSGTDASVDVDGGPDAGDDGGNDAGTDAGEDGGSDASVISADGGFMAADDAGGRPDAGPQRIFVTACGCASVDFNVVGLAALFVLVRSAIRRRR